MMRAFSYIVLCLLLLLASSAAAQQRQQNVPRIGYVYPAGGKRGSSFQVTIGGQFLEGVHSAYVSGSGVKATIVELIKPLPAKEATLLRDQLKELQNKRDAARGVVPAGTTRPAIRPTWTADDEKQLAETQKKLATYVRKPSSPAISETAILQIAIAANAEVGQREIRLATPTGLTNPMVFQIDHLAEFSKKAASPVDMQNPNSVKAGAQSAEMNVVLPAVINGQITPGDVDRYRFKANRGQRLIAIVSARSLVPYIADAVPGWFQATVGIYDAKGKELAYTDHYRFNPDPVLCYDIPHDGEYTIEIKDSIYRGREDFVYRIALGELPFITSIYPLGGKAGASTAVELKGWNLPVTSLNVDTTGKAPGILPVGLRRGERLSNLVSFAADTLPECMEQEPNDSQSSAQSVTLPIIINGRIGKSGDCDSFRFAGRKGQTIVAEVQARRLGSPLDSILRLTDASGKQLAFNDDHEDKGAGLATHHADSYLLATLPADGTYYLELADVQRSGGPDYAYRLRISEPRPDFELRIVPSSIAVRAGANVPLTVYALRKDGFSGEIKLGLKDAPAGFAIGGGRIPAGSDQVRITLTAPRTQSPDPINLALDGRASVLGQAIVRSAVPADDMMQAFAYRHLVPAQELAVSITRPPAPRSVMTIVSPTPLRIPVGGTARVQIAWPARASITDLQFELSNPPAGISIQRATPTGNRMEIVLTCDGKVKLGLKGNLIVAAFAERTQPARTTTAPAARRRNSVGTSPAIPFEIVPR